MGAPGSTGCVLLTEVLVHIRTMAEGDLDGVLACLDATSVDTATPQRFREMLGTGAYRLDWTWIAEEGDVIAGLAVWWGFPQGDEPLALDGLYAAPWVEEPIALWARLIAESPGDEYHLFVTPGWRDDPAIADQVRPRLAAAAAAGLTDVVERLRYEWTPAVPVPWRPARLEFRPEPDDERFVEVFERIAKGSLDAATRAAVAHVGPRAAAAEDVAMYRMMPGPRDRWRLAFDGSGQLVGCALPSANAGGPVVGYLGVVPEQRGHGYVDDLLSEITAILVADGATRVLADTDTTNTPMAAAFDRAGYRLFALRLVASRPL
jgi:RimJ/RimL family protein N-acetyltransferase